jgi:hypothetical protein
VTSAVTYRVRGTVQLRRIFRAFCDKRGIDEDVCARLRWSVAGTDRPVRGADTIEAVSDGVAWRARDEEALADVSPRTCSSGPFPPAQAGLGDGDTLVARYAPP